MPRHKLLLDDSEQAELCRLAEIYGQSPEERLLEMLVDGLIADGIPPAECKASADEAIRGMTDSTDVNKRIQGF